MNNSEDNARTFGLIAISTSVHIFLFVGLGFAPSPGEALMRHALEFEVLDKKKWESTEIEPEESEQKKTETPDENKPRKAPRPRAKPKTPTPPKEPSSPEQPPPTNEPEGPVDFSGITLTSQGGSSSWTTVVGDGSAIEKPVVIPKRVIRNSHNSSDGSNIRRAFLDMV